VNTLSALTANDVGQMKPTQPTCPVARKERSAHLLSKRDWFDVKDRPGKRFAPSAFAYRVRSCIAAWMLTKKQSRQHPRAISPCSRPDPNAAALHCRSMSAQPTSSFAPRDVIDQPIDDTVLMQRYARGDAAAFDELYNRHRVGLYGFVKRLAPALSQGERDEVFQDVWMRVIEARARYEASAQFRTWIYTIARNRVMDELRKSGREVSAEADDGDSGNVIEATPASRVQEPHVQAESRKQGAAIVAALENLPAVQREAFLLYEEGGMSVQEIADATGTTFEAAKSRLRYAIAKLREQLSDWIVAEKDERGAS
jgi:RNA polymerase sigma-70 factor, ECF subfamily